jgi:large subunit ribosomal protein L4
VLLHDDEADAGKSFRNIPRVSVMPVEDAGVADVIGAASVLVSEAALPALVARATGVAAADDAKSDAAETKPEPKAEADKEEEGEE